MNMCLPKKYAQEFEKMLNTPDTYVVYNLVGLKKGTEKYTLFNNQGKELFVLTKTNEMPQVVKKARCA